MVVVMESEVLSALALPAINKVVVLAMWRLLISTNPKQAIMLNWRQRDSVFSTEQYKNNICPFF